MAHPKLKNIFNGFEAVPQPLPSVRMHSREMELPSSITESVNKTVSELQPTGQSEALDATPLKEADIRHLPEELLSEIFYAAYNSGESPWTFTQVSRHWRKVAFATPRLWRKVAFLPKRIGETVRHRHGFEICRTPGELKKALYRSKGAPLEVKINISFERMFPAVPSDVGALASVLNPSASRIVALTTHLWTGASTNLHSKYSTLVTEPLKSLEELIIFGDMDLDITERLLEVANATALSLRKLKLIGFRAGVSPDFTKWSRIPDIETDGAMTYHGLSQLVNVRQLYLHSSLDSSWLDSIPSLTLLKLEKAVIFNPHQFFTRMSTPVLRTLRICGNLMFPVSSPLIHLPSLLELEIHGPVKIYMDLCISPNLKSLRIRGPSGGFSTILGAKEGRRVDMNPHLQSIELEYVNIEPEVLVTILRRYPNIKYVHFNQVSCTPKILPRLSVTGVYVGEGTIEVKEDLCLSLERLSVQYETSGLSQTTLQGLLRSVLSSRDVAGLPLTELLFFKYKRGKATAKNLVNIENTDSDGEQSSYDSCSTRYHR